MDVRNLRLHQMEEDQMEEDFKDFALQIFYNSKDTHGFDLKK